MNDASSEMESAIKDFAGFLPTIATTDATAFDTAFHQRLNQLNEMTLLMPDQRRELMSMFFAATAELFPGMMQMHSRMKPLGYSGDHLIIDWIYTRKTSPDRADKVWDDFFHRQAAPQAVRNRKSFFCETFQRLFNSNSGKLSVLNIASGPCRDVAEALGSLRTNPDDVFIHCVDMDNEAIAYAQLILNGASAKATFKWDVSNALRLKPSCQYDLVWSAGLFDYLEDRYAIALLKRMWGWTKDGGSMIFGNFHPRNPSRNYMEWCGDWFLIHRTEEEMALLCKKAGVPHSSLIFHQEPLGVNIFCEGRK